MKKYILIIAMFFTIGISGCKKDFLSLEVNPNQPSVSPPQLTLSGALVVAAAIVNENYSEYGCWVGYWTPSGNYVPNGSLQQFQITNTAYTGVWTSLYQNLTNFNNLQKSSAATAGMGNFQAIAMIMKAFDFEQLVDQFGDVPYSQAFQPSSILFPAYDKQQAIYNDLVKQLDAAINLIKANPSATNPGASDVVFGGVMANWQRFANTLKLRIAIRQSTQVPGNTASTDLASTVGPGYPVPAYLDDTQDAEVNPGYSQSLSFGNSQESPFWAEYGYDTNGNPTFGNVYYRGNNFFINTLNNFNDPRINAIYTPTTGSNGTEILGNTFGDVITTQSNPNTSAPGPGLLQSVSQSAVLISSAEACFLLSEGVLDGYITSGTAKDYYQRGITASFVRLNTGATAAASAALAVTYYGQEIKNVGWASSSANYREAIIYQKWIALVGYSNLEAYLEFQRTGFPILPSPISIDPAAVSTFAPIRQYYPLSELTSNPNNVAKEGTINIFTTNIFWEPKK
jgi:hypothetical protein